MFIAPGDSAVKPACLSPGVCMHFVASGYLLRLFFRVAAPAAGAADGDATTHG